MERPKLTQPHRLQRLPAILSPQLLRKGGTKDRQLRGVKAVDPAGPGVDRLLSLLARLESEAQTLPPTSLLLPISRPPPAEDTDPVNHP